MNILVINAGSSSLKYQLIDMKDESLIAKGMVERIGIEGSNLRHSPTGREPIRVEQPVADHVAAVQLVMDALMDPETGVIRSVDEIHAVGHRVLHGGEAFAGSFLIDDCIIDAVKENIPLGPLHNPANLMGIEACQRVMPDTPMVAVFDTAFHQTMPPKAFIYGIPYDYYRRLKIRRYGFHGTSHRYVSKAAADFLGRDAGSLRVITCHLGNGSSIAAVKNGKCVDTSMGLTPLEGVLMGTRSGDMDPAIIKFIMDSDGVDIERMDNILNKESGLLGLSEKNSDMRDIIADMEAGDMQAKLAYDVFVYRIQKYIGAYAAAMGGVDALVFTAGIGENNPEMCEHIVEGLDFMGIAIDPALNTKKSPAIDISAPGAKVRTLVIATNEELMIARDTLDLVGER